MWWCDGACSGGGVVTRHHRRRRHFGGIDGATMLSSSSLSTTTIRYVASSIANILPVENSCSILTASVMIHWTTFGQGCRLRWLKSEHAKSACIPSSTGNVRPGMRPCFFNQNMEAKEPEKKTPSTAAKAIKRPAKVERWSGVHLRAQSALRNARDGVHGVEKVFALRRNLWIGVDQERIGL